MVRYAESSRQDEAAQIYALSEIWKHLKYVKNDSTLPLSVPCYLRE